jgi:menaquinone-dependent protoporphyrinogen oxidase
MRVSVVYATTHGHTGKIAARLAETMAAEGASVETIPAGEAALSAIRRADAVVIAGSVHRGSHQAGLTEFVGRHHRLLRDMPTAFVSVSLTAAEEDDELHAETRRVIDEFVEDTGWTPDTQIAVAGAFQFSKYNPFERLVMRLIAGEHEIEIDPHADRELTDWAAVDDFARNFVTRARKRLTEQPLPQGRQARQPRTPAPPAAPR